MRFRHYHLIIAVFVLFSGCAPMGSVFSDNLIYDDFWTVSKRATYIYNNDSFRRDTDILVFASSGGAVVSIDAILVNIAVVENPDAWDPDDLIIREVIGRDPLPFDVNESSPGRKLVLTTYRGNEASFSVQVLDPSGGGNNNNNGNGDGLDGVTILW